MKEFATGFLDQKIPKRNWRTGFVDLTRDLILGLPVGKKTILGALLRLLRLDGVFIARVGRTYMAIDPMDWDGAFNLYASNGVFETDVLEFIVKNLPSGGTFLDVGANKGFFTIKMREIVGPQGRGLSFEPVPENLRDLRASLLANGFKNVEVIAKAAADEIGQANFVTVGLADGNSGWGHLAEKGTEGNLNVETTTLDFEVSTRGIKQIDLVKIDVEGAELRVLQGMEYLLKMGRVVTVIVEVHTGVLGQTGCVRIFTLMQALGFQANGIGEEGSALVSSIQQTASVWPPTPLLPGHRAHVYWEQTGRVHT